MTANRSPACASKLLYRPALLPTHSLLNTLILGLVAGDTVRLAAEATDANGHAVAEAEFEWASSDGSVAAVDASGLVRGVGEGTATITATAGSARGTAVITDRPDSDRDIVLDHGDGHT